MSWNASFPISWNRDRQSTRKFQIRLNNVSVEVVVSAHNDKVVEKVTYQYILREGPQGDLELHGRAGVEIVSESEAAAGYDLRPMSLRLDCPLSSFQEMMDEQATEPWTIKVFRHVWQDDIYHPPRKHEEIIVRFKKEDTQTAIEAREVYSVGICADKVNAMLQRARMNLRQTHYSYERTREYITACTWDVDLPKADFAGFASGSCFTLTMGPWIKESAHPELVLKVRLLASTIVGTHEAVDVVRRPTHVVELLSHFFGVDPFRPYDEERSKEDIAWFYAQISKYHAEEELESTAYPIQHPDLNVTLRPYQKAAVQWMLHREGRLRNLSTGGTGQDVVQRFQQKLYLSVELQSDRGSSVKVYYNKYAGTVFWDRAEMPDLPNNTGILADEMGLGKTIQALALILLNPRVRDVKEGIKIKDEPAVKLKDGAGDIINDEPGVKIKAEPGVKIKAEPGVKIKAEPGVKIKAEPGVKIKAEPGVKIKEEPGLNVKAEPLQTDPKQKKLAINVVKADSGLSQASRQPDQPSTSRGRPKKTTLSSYYLEGPKSTRNVSVEISCSKCEFTQFHYMRSGLAQATWSEQQTCSNCYVNSDTMLEAKTTLIVVPDTISFQWMEEITRHTSLSVHYYKGRSVKNTTFFPTFLGLFDIVLTTFSVLCKELNFVDIGKESRQRRYDFRTARSAGCFPQSCPLPCICWWRIMVDEAQEIPEMDSKLGIMTRTLSSVNRWCITGTPMSNGVNDLFALFCFMDVSPISIKKYWDWLVSQPYYHRDVSIFYELFGRLMWRTEKKNVLDQLNVPAQTNMNLWLQFSSIESHFYQRHLINASVSIIEKVNSLIESRRATLGTKLGGLDQHTLKILMREFVELRKACCHPQVLGKQTTTGSALTASRLETFTMDTVLTQLVKYGRDEGRTALRTATINLNRLGDALKGQGDLKGAVQAWNKLEDFMRVYNARFGSKPALLELDGAIRRLLNLNQASGSRKGDILDVERAAELERRQKELEADYTKPQFDLVNSTFELASGKATQLNSELNEVRLHNWWERVVQAVGASDELNFNALSLMMSQQVAKRAKKIVDLDIGEEWAIVLSLRQDLVSKLAQLPNSQLPECGTCGTPVTDDDDYDCDVCVFEDDLSDYLRHFYNHAAVRQLCPRKSPADQKENWDEFTGTDEVQRLRELEEEFNEEADMVLMRLEAVVQVLFDAANESQATLKALAKIVLTAATSHKALIISMKEEAKAMAQLTLALKNKATALREWKSKYEQDSKAEAEKGGDPDKATIALANKVETSRRIVRANEEKLAHAMGRILYLENSSADKTETSNECQICINELGTEWSVLLCGHAFCSECVRKLVQNEQALQCPVCRMLMKFSDVHLVGPAIGAECFAKPNTHSNCPGGILLPSRVQGSYSTKVDGIVETVLKIQEGNHVDKIIIFSTWSNLLEIIGYALRQNGVSHVQAKGKSTKVFGTAIQKFKDSDTTVLLLLLADGCKGLNLIEATHVILAEPVLNTASELQAVGRVHRMGQTKPTYVYRFYVKDTIEDHLQGILATEAMSGVSENEEGLLSVQDLKDLVTVN